MPTPTDYAAGIRRQLITETPNDGKLVVPETPKPAPAGTRASAAGGLDYGAAQRQGTISGNAPSRTAPPTGAVDLEKPAPKGLVGRATNAAKSAGAGLARVGAGGIALGGAAGLANNPVGMNADTVTNATNAVLGTAGIVNPAIAGLAGLHAIAAKARDAFMESDLMQPVWDKLSDAMSGHTPIATPELQKIMAQKDAAAAATTAAPSGELSGSIGMKPSDPAEPAAATPTVRPGLSRQAADPVAAAEKASPVQPLVKPTPGQSDPFGDIPVGEGAGSIIALGAMAGRAKGMRQDQQVASDKFKAALNAGLHRGDQDVTMRGQDLTDANNMLSRSVDVWKAQHDQRLKGLEMQDKHADNMLSIADQLYPDDKAKAAGFKSYLMESNFKLANPETGQVVDLHSLDPAQRQQMIAEFGKASYDASVAAQGLRRFWQSDLPSTALTPNSKVRLASTADLAHHPIDVVRSGGKVVEATDGSGIPIKSLPADYQQVLSKQRGLSH